MSTDRLENLFHPRSVAVVGACDRPGSVGQAVMSNLIEAGFEGPLYPVNRRRGRIMGRKSYAALARIGDPVDLVLLAVPVQAIPETISQCSQIGAAVAVILLPGAKGEAAAVHRTAAAICAAAAGSSLRFIGPTSLGVLCAKPRLNASLSARMPLGGKLAFISQSGATCSAILDFSLQERIGFSHLISLGAMLDMDFGEIIDYLGGDPAVGSILMHVESLSRHRNFMSAARAVSRVKPIIVLKSGRTPAGAAAAARHTGVTTGDDAVYEAAFQRAGIVRVRTFVELFDAAEILSRQGRYHGPGLAILTNAGGPGVMAVDALADYGLQPVVLEPGTVEALDTLTADNRGHDNPVDIRGDATPERFASAASILVRASEVDALLVLLAPQAMTDAHAVAQKLAATLGQVGKPVVTAWMGGDEVELGRRTLDRAGLATFDTPERAVRAFANLHRHARGIELLQQIPPRLSARIEVDREAAGRLIDTGLATATGQLAEVEAKDLLSAYGIPVNPTRKAASADEAVVLAQAYGFPVTMKSLSPTFANTTDAERVLRSLNSTAAVKIAFKVLMERAISYGAWTESGGVTIAPMIDDPHYELILSVRRDADFGPVIRFSIGREGAGLVGDEAIGLPPLNRLLAARLMEGSRAERLLQGYRHHLPADREQLELVLVRLSQLVTDFPEIVELDINPLLIATGQPTVGDAWVLLKPAVCSAPMHLSISPYPAQLESHKRVPEIGDLLVRPVRPEDAVLLTALFGTLSPRSIYYRFFTPLKQLSHQMLARFTQIDYDREIALVAILHADGAEKMIGAARVILQRNLKDAEFAVLVGDPWQGKGIGAHLLAACLDIARERGLGTIWGTVLAENKGMLALGRKLGFDIRRSAQSGEYELSLCLQDSKDGPADG